MKRCPKCGHSQFIVTQHVTQTVVVDGSGSFVKQVTACDEVTHAADDDDIWMCENCSYDASGEEFNVTDQSQKGV